MLMWKRTEMADMGMDFGCIGRHTTIAEIQRQAIAENTSLGRLHNFQVRI